MDRRTFLGAAALTAASGGPLTGHTIAASGSERPSQPVQSGATTGPTMYGVIGKMSATPGSRDALIAILLEGTTAMPGCLAYVVARDTEDADGIWISEVWESEGHHKASLALPEVKAAIARARPMITGFSNRVVTTPVGGVGLPARPA